MSSFPCLQEVQKDWSRQCEFMGDGAVSKDFVVRMIHCYARSSRKIKQNFTAAKVTKYTQTQSP